jgi:uncharacterized protein YdcH (DUF465 family)
MENSYEVNHNNVPRMLASLFDRLDSLEHLIKNITTAEKLNPSERLTRRQLKEEYFNFKNAA